MLHVKYRLGREREEEGEREKDMRGGAVASLIMQIVAWVHCAQIGSKLWHATHCEKEKVEEAIKNKIKTKTKTKKQVEKRINKFNFRIRSLNKLLTNASIYKLCVY